MQRPTTVKGRLAVTVDQIDILQKKVKPLQQKSHQLSKKVTSLQEVVDTLRNKNLVSANGVEMLSKTFSDVPAEAMKGLLANKASRKLSWKSYPPELKAFAFTLQFYSAKAYKYVRKCFDFTLPHPSVIKKWYSGVNGEPGFTDESFSALKVKVEKAKEKGSEVICTLMMDEMVIKKHTEWDGSKFHGYVDIGVGVYDDTTPLAHDALVLMVVAMNSNWKIPVGYFLINGMSGEEKANLVQQCLTRLHDVGVSCVSLTCDGPSCHLKMLEELGATMNVPALDPSFTHPANPNQRVHVLLDVCHMLKLIRNTLASGCILTNHEGGKISWNFINELHKLQEEGLLLGNKLGPAHVQWEKQKTKVNLAAQALSSSVADAIEFCDTELHLQQFKGSEATVEFIRYIDHLFEIMNSRNPLARNYKAPMRKENEGLWRKFLQDAYSYLSKLTHGDGQPLYESRRKTPFIGFLVGIKSLMALYDSLVGCEEPKLRYLLTYKLSQDHLEQFFCMVRSVGGTSSNLTARQFQSVYKQLLIRQEIEGQGRNWITQDKTPVLHVSSSRPHPGANNTDEEDMLLIRRYDLEDCNPSADEHDYMDVPNFIELSPVIDAAIGYIAGYAVQMAKRRTICPECQEALIFDSMDAGGGLLKKKSRGGVVESSADVVKVCQTAERCIQRLLHSVDAAVPQSVGIVSALSTTVLHDIGFQPIFMQLAGHMLDCPPDHNHVFFLIKCIAACYIKIRMHHLAKHFNEKMTGSTLRKHLTELVLHRHE